MPFAVNFNRKNSQLHIKCCFMPNVATIQFCIHMKKTDSCICAGSGIILFQNKGNYIKEIFILSCV